MWQYVNQQGAGIRTALDWLLPYALKQKTWTYQQIGEYKPNNIYALLQQAAAVYNEPQYAALAKKLDDEVDDVVIDLLNK
jgi:hypothetical protein